MDTTGLSGQYLTFRLSQEEYAVPILRAREVLSFGVLTRMPGMPPCVLGMLNLRGRVVPVVDLSLRFGRGATPVTRRTCVLIIETAWSDEPDAVVGLVVDEASQVLDVRGDAVRPPPRFGTAVRDDLLVGCVEQSERFVLLLEVNRILAVEEILRLTERPSADAEAA